MEPAGGSVNLNSHFTEWMSGYSAPIPTVTTLPPVQPMPTTDHSAITHISQLRSIMSFYSSALYGNKKVFVPRWSPELHLQIHSILHLINGLIYTTTHL
ncbi:MAG TPA: hypothetical protein VFD60_06275 [Nitrososphaeraceae archaeon]|nr:hypothetical protein [Nitrososphaeraceae archaeon]